jgi:hypothetical protein
VKLTTHLHLVPRSNIVEVYIHSPAWLLGVFNYALGHLFVCVCIYIYIEREREREGESYQVRSKTCTKCPEILFRGSACYHGVLKLSDANFKSKYVELSG